MRDLIHIRVIRLLLLAVSMLFLSTVSFAQVGVSVTIAPPELPVFDQPICPGDGYIWTPGYWAWDGEYYWVPGRDLCCRKSADMLRKPKLNSELQATEL